MPSARLRALARLDAALNLDFALDVLLADVKPLTLC
jgi:hypothetical protein